MWATNALMMIQKGNFENNLDFTLEIILSYFMLLENPMNVLK